MVQDNPYLEVWRSLSLDQTELNLSLPFCANCWQRGREIHKDSKIGRGANKWNNIDSKIGGGANKWNDIVRVSINQNAYK